MKVQLTAFLPDTVGIAIVRPSCTEKSPCKTIIDLVMAADCLDAATDTIGRSYQTGKTFDDYCGEVEASAGTRYAPYLPELLQSRLCREDIEYLLSDGRERMYRETFRLLKRMGG